MPNTRTKTEVQLTRKLVVKATEIRAMDEDSVLQLVGKLLDVAQDSGGKVGPQNNWNPYYYNPYQNMRPAWFASFSKTSTSCKKKPTRKRSPTRGPAPSDWPG